MITANSTSASLGPGPCTDDRAEAQRDHGSRLGRLSLAGVSSPGPLTTILAAFPGSLTEVWPLQDSVSSSVEWAASEQWGRSGDRVVFPHLSLQCPGRVPRMSSAARMGSASPWNSSAIWTGTVWTGRTRRPAPCPPAAPPPSSATARPASPSCGLVTVTPTARMAQMSGRSTVGAPTRPPRNRTAALARRSSFTARAGNASTPAGAVMVAPTARTSRTRRIAVRALRGGGGGRGALSPVPALPRGWGGSALGCLNDAKSHRRNFHLLPCFFQCS